MNDAFLDNLRSFNLPMHLVLDGAIVENIEDCLTAHKLIGRPLFRETADRAILLAGPWLVSSISDLKTLERCKAAAQNVGKGIFWLGEGRSDALYTHLRHLNVARMPDGHILYFRHYDSDVLASVAPLLNAEQAAHLFGPSLVMAFIGGCGDGATVEKPDGLPEPARGPITFEPWQIQELDKRQRMISRKKIAQLLRAGYPKQTSHLSNSELDERMLLYETEAGSINLTSEAAIANWARLDLETDGLSSRSSELKRDIARIPLQKTNDVFMQCMPRLLESFEHATKSKTT